MADITLGTIYEDVAELQQQMAELQDQVMTLQSLVIAREVKQIATDTDLNGLTLGEYVIPSATICSTLLNKPLNSNATGFIRVVAGGIAGQLMMYYYPCVKDGSSYYQRAYYENSWGNWHEVNLFDSGWLDLSLNSDVIAFNTEQKPRYRRIGKEVFLSGAIKNISANGTVIATLPVNYRPSKKIIVAIPSSASKFSQISIQTTGVITYEQMDEGTPIAGNWHSVACSFCVE